MLPACSCLAICHLLLWGGGGAAPFCGLEADGAVWPLYTDHGWPWTSTSCSWPRTCHLRSLRGHLLPERAGREDAQRQGEECCLHRSLQT